MSSYPQAGITNRPPEHLLLASFNFVEGTELRQAIEGLRTVVEHELESRLDPPNLDKTISSAETGELGFQPDYDRTFLTITLGLSASGVQKLALPEPPADLRTIPWGDLVDAPLSDVGGDLVLQICADNLYICEHVVRRVEEELGDKFSLNSAFIGSQRYNSRPGRTARREGRALIGFLDGTSNLNPRKSNDDAKLVFVDPNEVPNYPQNPPAGELPTPSPYQQQPTDPKPLFPELHPVPTAEPAWTKNGSYMTVRVSTFDTRDWDKLTQDDQEKTIGRFKVHGASLDLTDSDGDLDKDPVFATDKTNTAVSIAAHIRKANPRGNDGEDAKRRIFRRGYPLIGPGVGELQRGLIFVAFGRSITTQFEFIVRAWMRNKDFPVPDAGLDPLFSKVGEAVLGGGYYFIPPLEHKTRPWTWILPEA
jgi:deferrochelatase/peroxidase EfeB